MASSKSNIEAELDDSNGDGGGGGDAEWLASLTEPELDFLISLKELVTIRAKTIGHIHLADKFDVKMLRALGVVLLEYFREHAQSDCTPNLAETLARFNGCGLATQNNDVSPIPNEGKQPSSFSTQRRKRMWDGLCEETPYSCKRQKTAEGEK